MPLEVGNPRLRFLKCKEFVNGVAPEQALLFSVCFGLALALGSLPGALAWLLYSFPPARPSAELGA